MPQILLLPGDGIGPEVVGATRRVLEHLNRELSLDLRFSEALVGGASIDAHGIPLTPEALHAAKGADAVLLGAVGGPKWEPLDFSVRPERALLALRKELGLFANLRPARVYPALANASTLKHEVVAGVDLVVVRELTGGIYFGEPRGVAKNEHGRREGFNTLRYDEDEIRRIARVAFALAQKRSRRLCSVDKANVLEVTELWRTVVTEEHANFRDVELSHMYVDNAAMQLIRNPKQFDVMVTTNMFGDILSDAAAMLTGSIGMLPSASVGSGHGMYEPVHGSAPDIAGQGLANPLATILSAAMMFESSLGRSDVARRIDAAVDRVLADGLRTRDLGGELGTDAMADAVIARL